MDNFFPEVSALAAGRAGAGVPGRAAFREPVAGSFPARTWPPRREGGAHRAARTHATART